MSKKRCRQREGKVQKDKETSKEGSKRRRREDDEKGRR